MKVIKILKIVIGTLFMAMAVNFVYEPMHMVTGGVSGIAIIVKSISRFWVKEDIPVWLTNILLNIPIFFWGYFVRGKKYLSVTFFANLCFTAFLYLLPIVSVRQRDFFLAALYGGVLTGIGLGFVFSSGYSTGGTDLLSSILKKYSKRMPVASILFILDAVVILAGMFVFGVTTSAYAVLAVFLSSKLMDTILTGLKIGKQVWIISEQHEQIGKDILQQMDRGVTGLSGKGLYSNQEKNVLICIVSPREISQIIQIVTQNDGQAFVFIQDVKEVMGEGFEEIGS